MHKKKKRVDSGGFERIWADLSGLRRLLDRLARIRNSAWNYAGFGPLKRVTPQGVYVPENRPISVSQNSQSNQSVKLVSQTSKSNQSAKPVSQISLSSQPNQSAKTVSQISQSKFAIEDWMTNCKLKKCRLCTRFITFEWC